MFETIDIILPNYNKQPYIQECLDSLLSQTYTNWQCIVVDSFSDDGSWEIIENISQNDSRFKLYKMAKPKVSVYEAWNFGLSKVKNPYFCVLTSDDVWDSQWLEIGIESLARNESAVCSAARAKLMNANSEWGPTPEFNLLGERFFSTDELTPQLRSGLLSSIASYFIGPIYTTIHSLLMRSEVLKAGAKFAEDVGSTADYEWYISLGFFGDIVYHPQVEVAWRIYEGQATKHREQEKYGELIQKIHARAKDSIVCRLASDFNQNIAEQFQVMAEYYDRTILRYHYARPYLVNLRQTPFVELPKLLRILLTMPRECALDCLFKLKGQYFFYEESLAIAKKFSDKIIAKS